jgi:dTDP-glucose pyrophosphorylase
MHDKIKELVIKSDASILEALKQMDLVSHKLLIILEGDLFIGLVTIGDIQRSIIKNMTLDTPVYQVIRSSFILAFDDETMEEIKQKMVALRLEFMPVLDRQNRLVDVYFWDDVFSSGHQIPEQQQLHIPVVVMAGGYGTRLKPLTNIIPKPLIPIGEKSILETIIDSFNKAGVKDFYISVNYKAEMIKFYFDSIANKNYNLSYFKEDKPLGTAGSLHLLKDKLSTSFFVSNCDIIVDQDYTEVFKYHQMHQNELTLVASLKNYSIPYGTVESGPDGRLTTIEEKPELTFMINCGLYILEPHLLDEIPVDEFFHITHLIQKIKDRQGKIGVFPISEKSWTDIGDWKEYRNVINQL